MKYLRTPDERFEDLVAYNFSPNYLTIDDGESGELRLHYLDEGPKDGLVVLLMHGEPSWSYLYRKMIPGLVNAGCRVVAPDLIGFGRSDKPTKRSDYTYQRHVDWMARCLHALDLQNALLFCQDWGGLIGLRLVAAEPERFCAVVAANTFLPTGDHAASEAFKSWQDFSQSVAEFPAGKIVQGATVMELSEEVVAAYDAPYPDESYKEGARQFPMLVPTSPDNPACAANITAWQALAHYEKPFLTAFSDQDPITEGGEKVFQKLIPGCKNQAHVTIKGGGHFLQEDKGEHLATVVIDFIKHNHLV